ncbi:MAG: hypothetical protein ACRECZ_03215, partial [Methylocella sp.]
MVDYESDDDGPKASPFSLRAFLIRDWPYFAMLALALFGVAYTSIARKSMTNYWIILVPFYCVICVITRWREVEGKAPHWHLIQTEVLHWVAVLAAMSIVFVADVKQMMNSDASALMLLTLLALGTFTAGIHVAAWRICLVGVVLAVAVPAIAWLEQATLLLLLVAIVLVTIAVLYVMHN